jgi:hypothetical protein
VGNGLKNLQENPMYVNAMITLPFMKFMDKHYEILGRDGMAKQSSSLEG